MTTNENYTECLDAFPAVKELLTIPMLWSHLGLQGEPSKRGLSPLRDDKNPSFSVYDEGRKFKDFTTGEGGSVVDFYMLATGTEDKAEAIAALKEICQLRTERAALPVKTVTPGRVVGLDEAGVWDLGTQGRGHQGPIDQSVLRFFKRKGIHTWVVNGLISEGSLAIEDSALKFRYNTGIKVRPNMDSSSDNRWLSGRAEDALWRYNEILKPNIRGVIITEGETDLMRVLSVVDYPQDWVIVAAPAASWRPSPSLASTIAHGRKVFICFDNDQAGIKGTYGFIKVIADNKIDCEVSSFPWDWAEAESNGDKLPNDMCDLEQRIIIKAFDQCFKMP